HLAPVVKPLAEIGELRLCVRGQPGQHLLDTLERQAPLVGEPFGRRLVERKVEQLCVRMILIAREVDPRIGRGTGTMYLLATNRDLALESAQRVIARDARAAPEGPGELGLVAPQALARLAGGCQLPVR